MKKMRRLLLWYGLLTKRQLKRPAYLALLLLVPLLALAVALSVRQDSGIVTVAVACEDPADPVSAAAVDRLLSGKSVLRFLTCAEAEDAKNAVIHGEADAAWIFRADTGEMLERYVQKGRGTIVTVIEREDNVFLKLAREKLYAAVYPDLSYTMFRRFLETLPGASQLLGEQELRGYYESGTMDEEIVHFAYADGSEVQNADSYLVAPLRGLLSLLIVLCGLASGMYCFREEREETFVWLPAGKRRLLPLVSHMTAIFPVAAAVLLALTVGGLLANPVYELLLMLCFSMASAAFCELIRRFCPSEAQMGALIPVLMVAMLVLCPVFLNFRLLRPVQYLLPPFYYLNAVHSAAYLCGMMLYTAAAVVLAMVFSGMKRRRA